jgi:hypothetical protein
MENYKQIAKEAVVSIESVRELMARACVKRVEMPYYRTTEDGCKVDAVDVFYAVYADYCSPAVVLGTGDTIAEAVSDALIH